MRRRNQQLRELIDSVIVRLKAGSVNVKNAAYQMLIAGAPFDVAVRTISRHGSAYPFIK